MHSDDDLTVLLPSGVGNEADQSAQKTTQSHLVLLARDGSASFPLEGEMLVGREVECKIAIDSGHISRYHAKIAVTPQGTYIEDLKSTNGTFINGQRITQRMRIDVGDEVVFHKLRFRLVSASSGDTDATIFSARSYDSAPANPIDSAALSTDGNFAKRADAARVKPVSPPRVSPQPFGKEDSGEHTQILSRARLDQMAKRSQHAKKDVRIGSGARMIVMTAPLRGKVFSLAESFVGQVWQIGRDKGADICLKDKTISLFHARIRKTPEGFELDQLEAKNGMIINGRAQNKVTLHHNDKIQLGRIALTFKDDVEIVPKEEGGTVLKLNRKLRRARYLMIGVGFTLIAAMVTLAASLLS